MTTISIWVFACGSIGCPFIFTVPFVATAEGTPVWMIRMHSCYYNPRNWPGLHWYPQRSTRYGDRYRSIFAYSHVKNPNVLTLKGLRYASADIVKSSLQPIPQQPGGMCPEYKSGKVCFPYCTSNHLMPIRNSDAVCFPNDKGPYRSTYSLLYIIYIYGFSLKTCIITAPPSPSHIYTSAAFMLGDDTYPAMFILIASVFEVKIS